MAAQCRDSFFLGEMIPPYKEKDVIQILKYYTQYESVPQFYSFDDIDRNKLDISVFEQSMAKTGTYACANCGKTGMNRIYFQVDHIKPLNKGGKTQPANLQLLCRQCNGMKGDLNSWY